MAATAFKEEKSKPFRLVKYFTFISLIGIFIGTLVLSMINIHWARRMQLEKSDEYAHLLIENLNHQVFSQFILPVALKFGKIQLSNPDQFQRMDKVVRSTLHSFKVDRVNIYDTQNNIVTYSFDTELIGKRNVGGTGYQNAVQGKSSSKLIQRGNFGEIFLGFPKDIRLITFAPLRAERPLAPISGPILGVIEIEQDLSQDYQTIFRFQILIIITCTAVMGLLFLVLILVVQRGEGIFRRRALEQLKLKEQLSRAEHLSSIGEMAAVISHEIRNPLGIIRSSAALLKKKMAAVNPDNTIPDIIVEESTRLNNIITDFFNFAKPKKPNLIPCRAEEVIEKNITFLDSQSREQGYVIKRSFPPDLPEINADADMLYQAFLNILINAMQAMPGGGTIDVSIWTEGEWLHLGFEDRGEGLGADVLKKIWDPFFTTKEKGTGLGLGIVKNIIEAHGGRSHIHNRPGGGARVIVELPTRQEG